MGEGGGELGRRATETGRLTKNRRISRPRFRLSPDRGPEFSRRWPPFRHDASNPIWVHWCSPSAPFKVRISATHHSPKSEPPFGRFQLSSVWAPFCTIRSRPSSKAGAEKIGIAPWIGPTFPNRSSPNRLPADSTFLNLPEILGPTRRSTDSEILKAHLVRPAPRSRLFSLTVGRPSCRRQSIARPFFPKPREPLFFGNPKHKRRFRPTFFGISRFFPFAPQFLCDCQTRAPPLLQKRNSRERPKPMEETAQKLRGS